MNRRNFLKLFGLLAVPSSVLALPAPKPQMGMIIITADLLPLAPYEQYKVDTGYNHDTEWIDFCPTTWVNLSSSNAFYCGDDKEITISFSGGHTISLAPPEWNKEIGEFNGIHIIKYTDGIDILL